MGLAHLIFLCAEAQPDSASSFGSVLRVGAERAQEPLYRFIVLECIAAQTPHPSPAGMMQQSLRE